MNVSASTEFIVPVTHLPSGTQVGLVLHAQREVVMIDGRARRAPAPTPERERG